MASRHGHRGDYAGVCGTALAAFAALIPFQAIGPWSVDRFIRFEISDWVLALSCPWLARNLWCERARVASSPVVRAFTLFSLAGTLSLLVPDGAWSIVELGRVWVPWLVIASLVALPEEDVPRVVRAAVSGGWIALTLSFVGYALVALGALPPVHGDLLFAFRSSHPVFDGMLRLAGTFGESCQSMGEYALVWLALCRAAPRSRALDIAELVAGTLAVLLTFSSAWVGLPLIATAGALRVSQARATKHWWWLAGGATLVLSAASSLLMNFGIPEPELGSRGARIEDRCDRMDREHALTLVLAADATHCQQLVDHAPYTARTTLYRHAKEVAWAAFGRAPWFGIGGGKFRAAARDDITQRFGHRDAVTFYQSPHSQYFGTLAERGLVGALCLLSLLVVLVHAARVTTNNTPLFATIVALALIGLNADLFHQRHVWLVAGLVAAKHRLDRRLSPRR